MPQLLPGTPQHPPVPPPIGIPPPSRTQPSTLCLKRLEPQDSFPPGCCLGIPLLPPPALPCLTSGLFPLSMAFASFLGLPSGPSSLWVSPHLGPCLRACLSSPLGSCLRLHQGGPHLALSLTSGTPAIPLRIPPPQPPWDSSPSDLISGKYPPPRASPCLRPLLPTPGLPLGLTSGFALGSVLVSSSLGLTSPWA